MPRFPMTLSPTNQPETEDEFVDLDFGACETCGSVQLMNLVDPEVLYAEAHNTTSHSATWRDHHSELARFILAAQTVSRSCLEVGGASGDLASLVAEHFTRYTILDLAPAVSNPRFTVIQGNCETYAFEAGSVLVLAHVFEHLYNPTRFVANCARHAVADVFISIPNMSDCATVPIHVEHTFFIDSSDIVRIFASAGYSLQASLAFREHSHFYHMRLASNGNDATAELQSNTAVSASSALARKVATVLMLKARQAYFLGLQIPDDAFVAPGGPYGQVLYYYSRCRIRCFLDNDIHKVGKRVYGTPHFVRPFTALLGSGAVAVYLYAGPYAMELRQQIEGINCNAQVILLED